MENIHLVHSLLGSSALSGLGKTEEDRDRARQFKNGCFGSSLA